MRIAIRVDASERIGAGHAMRCLTLADALKERGCELRFVAVSMLKHLIARIEEAGHELRFINPSDSGVNELGWDLSTASPGDQRHDATATMASLGGWQPDWLVVDHYRFDAHWERLVRKGGTKLLAIDDLAKRRHDCDILIDQTVGRQQHDYRALVPKQTELLIGSNYALLRPEFMRARPAAAERRALSGSVQRILLSLGMTDVGGMTENALAQALTAAPRCAIDVVLGSAAPSLEQVRRLADTYDRVTLHIDSEAMWDLMSAADLAIGAAGTTAWERCCLGLPTVTIALAPNQRTIADKLTEAGAIRLVDKNDERGISNAIVRLVADSRLRREMSANALQLCDGRGTRRVADRVLKS